MELGLFQVVDKLWTWLDSVPPVVGAIVGALLGVLGTFLFNRLSRRPKPLMFIDRVKVDRSLRPPNSITVPTEQTKRLMVDLADDPFVSEVIPLTGKIDEQNYVNCLEKASREIEEAKEYILPSVKDTATRLGEYANRERYEKLLKVWAEEQNIIWPLLNMLILHEEAPWDNVTIPDTGVATNDTEQPVEPQSADGGNHGQIDVDEHGDMYIHLRISRTLPFSRSLSFLWSGQRALPEGPGDPIVPVARYIDQVRVPPKNKEKLQELADRTARAVATRDKVKLREITNWLYEAAQSHKERLDALHKQIQRELKIYDRFVVRGQISNTGASPFSVVNDGILFVETKGHPQTEEEDEDRTQSYFETDTEIPVIMQDSEGRYDVPVSIEPGYTFPFAAVSMQRVDQMKHSQVLLDIFGAGDKRCYMGVRVTLPGRSRKRSKPRLYTPRRLFRDWKTGVDIPKRKRLLYALRAWLLRRLQGTADR